MIILLFRHGPAGKADTDRWPDDSLRPLTSRGIERTRKAASGIVHLEPGISRVLTSPYLRALATAHLLVEGIGDVAVEPLDALAPGGPGQPVMAAIEKLPPEATVAVVGHEPDLGLLAARMLGSAHALPFKKSGACAIAFPGVVGDGLGQLLWFLPPRALRRLAPARSRQKARRA